MSAFKRLKKSVKKATVVLTSNMAFLALPAVAQNAGEKATPSQIISQVSIINSMGSIIVGLMLLRQYSLLKENNMGEAYVLP